jgi:hypothetical protein
MRPRALCVAPARGLDHRPDATGWGPGLMRASAFAEFAESSSAESPSAIRPSVWCRMPPGLDASLDAGARADDAETDGRSPAMNATTSRGVPRNGGDLAGDLARDGLEQSCVLLGTATWCKVVRRETRAVVDLAVLRIECNRDEVVAGL